jgi:NEDD8-activating enzyme E1
MQWVYERAEERAKKYNIEGVTLMLTAGVVKNIIPAVASTNAIIAASCTNEVLKLLTFCSQSLNTYMMYMGLQGVYSHTFLYERNEECPVCSAKVQSMVLSKAMTVNELIVLLGTGDLRLKAPSITSGSGSTIYMQKPPALEKATRPNLDRPVSSLIDDGEELTVTDPVLEHISVSIRITFRP